MGAISDIQIRHWLKEGKPVSKAQGEVPGLNFTLSKGGTAAWVFRYRFGEKHRELTIGRYPEFTIKLAKAAAMEARFKLQNGIDPAREKRLKALERAGAMTVRELVGDYEEKVFPGLAENTQIQRRRYIKKWVLPKLGPIQAKDVNGADIVAVLESVGAKSVNVAEVVFTILSELFKHAIARHVVSSNPCAGITTKAVCGKATPPRQRLNLSDDELHLIFQELPSIGEQNALPVKILLGTCVRISELVKARWEDVDLGSQNWWVRDENSKMGRGFTVPLAPSIAECFERLKVLACGSEWVLPRRVRSRKEPHMDQRSINAQLVKLCDRTEGVRRFTPHDLRSTAKSKLRQLGFSEFLTERCLNHAISGVEGKYDQHDYLDERRVALNRWAEFIEACEQGQEWSPSTDNVVRIRQASL